jgi:hypothetical protein
MFMVVMQSMKSDTKLHPRFPLICAKNGDIYSLKTGKKRKLGIRKDGYLQISVGRSSYLAHRIIAEAHIPNPDGRPKINHKNGVKSDNSIENLEWCTQTENVRHARDILGVRYSKSGFQNPNSKFLASHQLILTNLHQRGFSVTWIAEVMGFAVPTIRRHLREIIRHGKQGSGPV